MNPSTSLRVSEEEEKTSFSICHSCLLFRMFEDNPDVGSARHRGGSQSVEGEGKASRTASIGANEKHSRAVASRVSASIGV